MYTPETIVFLGIFAIYLLIVVAVGISDFFTSRGIARQLKTGKSTQQ